jgi:hypothetical protein
LLEEKLITISPKEREILNNKPQRTQTGKPHEVYSDAPTLALLSGIRDMRISLP